ncbi:MULTISPECIES: hypothetical protein [unclassified Mesorhizobium]|uniref:hypothetical protein n=1 Tax=unclassified Mesorhizobium TaxID=325217 RepID=UPI000A8D8F0B|nr:MULTISPECIES: hypothetical protein [unclassified Mesorhizobium]
MKKPKPATEPAATAETEAALPLPQEGGSWIRQPDGSVVREVEPITGEASDAD